jgi:anthrone oxygenase-like protein
MRPGLLALIAAAMFFGAALYINLVEQPARLTLGDRAMMSEWIPSNRRGFLMLAICAIAAALLAYVDFSRTADTRWLIGAVVMLFSLPYAFYVMLPTTILLGGTPAAGDETRGLMRDWGLLEWAQAAIGLCGCAIFGWALAQPV